MYKMIEPYFALLISIVDGYCLFMLLEEFGERRIKKKWLNCLLVVSIWLLVVKILSYAALSAFSNSLSKQVLVLGLQMLIAYFISNFLYCGRQTVKLFVTLVYMALRFISAQIGLGIKLVLMYLIDHLAMVIDEMNNQKFIYLLIDILNFSEKVFILAVLYISVKIIAKNYKYAFDRKSVKEMISYMLLPFMGSFTSVISYLIIQLINERENIIYYDNYVSIYTLITTIFLMSWLTILYGFKLQQDVMGLTEQNIKEQVLKNQILQMQNSMTEMEHFYESFSKVKHDMKNQMAVMEKMLTVQKPEYGENKKEQNPEKDNGEMLQFFQDMQSQLDNLEQRIQTGNVVSDAVISSKFHYAAKEVYGIILDTQDFLLSDKVNVRAYDIGIILNNGLDNAIEACRKLHLKNPDRETYIKIKSFWKNQMFFIEIENSFDGSIIWGNDGYPCSTKKEEGIHGIGLRNIRRCALKYEGDMDCIADNEVFILSVMLKGSLY